jgi:hypothetical protein
MVFGGKQHENGNYNYSTEVIAYKPPVTAADGAGRWTSYHTRELTPLRTIEHSAVWTGYSMLVWGGQIFDRGFTSTGSEFFPGAGP